jgi:aminopeptidase
MGAIDPKRSAMAQAARRDLLTMSLRRLAEGATQYCLTEIPSAAAAQDAEMSLKDYAERVFRAGMLHLEDPVGAWMRLRGQSERALEYLRQRKEIRLRSPASDGSVDRRKHEGTDVTVNVEGRGWNNHSGATNFPDGEIDTGPREVDGVVNFTFPAMFKGREVDGIRLKYRAGKVVEASAVKNEAYLIALLEQDDGASTVGELGIGTNYELPGMLRNAFFDEKIGGTFHIAVGAGYPETGNTNESGLHWDMVSDLRRGGTMHADGELVQENGRFLKEGWPGA